MSDFVGAAINTADLASKLTGIAVDFMSGIGCEAFCEVLDVGKDVLFEAIRSGKINHQTKKALENLDQRTVDDLKHFVSQKLQKYSKKGKLPKELKGKDLVNVFMNRLDTVSKLVDDYAAENNLPEDRKIALKYILNEIRQCTAQASLNMLEAEDKRLVLVISQIVRNTFEDYREDFAQGLSKTLFYRPTHCSHCASPNLNYDDQNSIARCKNCGYKTQYEHSEQPDLLKEFKDELIKYDQRLDQLVIIGTQTKDTVEAMSRKLDSLTEGESLKRGLDIAQSYINSYRFSDARNQYRLLLKDNPTSVDVLWGALQAEFGIVYLRGYDEEISKPTFCYPVDRASKMRFCDHEYYKQIMLILENEPDRRAIYEARQREIDRAIATLKNDLNKKPEYDVFICVKIGLATDDGQIINSTAKTVDFEQYAKKVYKELTDQGLKVFCSQISRQQGIHYDEQIWSAMLRSKKILVIGTRRDYLESVWVQCEWRRWLYLGHIGVRSPDSFVALIPSEDDWADIRPREWEEKRITVYTDIDGAVKALADGLIENGPTPDPIHIHGIEEDIFDIRALLDHGNVKEAKKRLTPLLAQHPGNGALQLLDLRIKSNNFKNRKKVTRHDIDVACRYLKEDPEDNPEYQMFMEQTAPLATPAPAVPKKAPAKPQNQEEERAPKKEVHFPWKPILAVVAVICAIAAVVFGCIYFESAKHWIIAITIGVAYAGIWNLIRWKYGAPSGYYILYAVINIGLGIACIPLYCVSDVTRAYAFGFALGIFVSAIGLLIQSKLDKNEMEDLSYEHQVSLYSIFAGGILFAISIGCLCKGTVATLVIGCCTAIVYVISICVKYWTVGRDNDSFMVLLTFLNLALMIVGLVFMFISYNFAILAICLLSAATFPFIVVLIGDGFDSNWWLVFIGGLLIIAAVSWLSMHKLDTDTFVIENGILISYGGAEEVVVIPEEVVAIDDKAFDFKGPQTNMKQIVFHDEITSIGEKAFQNCDALTTVTIPAGVTTISESVFRDCDNLASVIMHDNIKSIEANAFRDCDALTTVTIPGSVKSIPDNAFRRCNKLASVTIEEGVTEIGDNAFTGCFSLTSVQLPDSMQTLGMQCFSDCTGLTDIYIGEGVTFLGAQIFASGAVITIHYSGTETQWDNIKTEWPFKWSNSCTGYELVCGEVFEVENGVLLAYRGTDEVVVIPEEITAIGDGAFNFSQPQKHMKQIVLHENIESIGQNAFRNCDSLETVTIPGSVSKVSASAFRGCDALSSVIIEEGVTEIGENAFEYCSALTSVTLPGSMQTLNDYCFAYCKKLKEIHINAGVTYMGTAIFCNGAPMTIYYDGTQEEWESIKTPSVFKWKYCIAGYEIIYGQE